MAKAKSKVKLATGIADSFEKIVNAKWPKSTTKIKIVKSNKG